MTKRDKDEGWWILLEGYIDFVGISSCSWGPPAGLGRVSCGMDCLFLRPVQDLDYTDRGSWLILCLDELIKLFIKPPTTIALLLLRVKKSRSVTEVYCCILWLHSAGTLFIITFWSLSTSEPPGVKFGSAKHLSAAATSKNLIKTVKQYLTSFLQRPSVIN